MMHQTVLKERVDGCDVWVKVFYVGYQSGKGIMGENKSSKSDGSVAISRAGHGADI